MEISSVSCFSLRMSNPIVSMGHNNNNNNNIKASSHHNIILRIIKSISYGPSKYCSTQKFHPKVPPGLYRQHSGSKSLWSSHQRQDFITCAQVGNAPESDPPLLTKVAHFGNLCLGFIRPYTIRATLVSSIALFAKELLENSDLYNWSLILRAAFGLLALICANSCIAGINQIFDIEIDRINKPYLPIASGDFSVKTAWLLVIFFTLAGLVIVRILNSGTLITSLYCLSLFLGIFYSAPPFRFKKSPVATILTMATVRGFNLNFGVCYATKSALGFPFEWRAHVTFIITFATLLAVVLALTKDLSDVEGDRKYEVETAAVKFGVRNIAIMASGLLLLNYVAAIVAAIMLPQALNRYIMLPAHAILAFCLIYQFWKLEQANYSKEECQRFYQFIWILLYAEYVIYLFI